MLLLKLKYLRRVPSGVYFSSISPADTTKVVTDDTTAANKRTRLDILSPDVSSLRPRPIPPTQTTAFEKPYNFAEILHKSPNPVIASTDAKKVLSFDEVPGPPVFRHIARLWSVIPVMGTEMTASAIQYMLSAGSQLAWGGNLRIFRWLFDEYGPVVRLHGPFGGDVVIVSRPEHVHAIFENEGPRPIRSCLDSVETYRLKYRRHKISGPFNMSGQEWEHLREAIEAPLKKCVQDRFQKIEATCDDLVKRIERIRNRVDEVSPNFKYEIYKWSMECLCSVTVNRKVGFLDQYGFSSTSEASRLLESLYDATDSIRKCEHGLHLWKFIDTPTWKNLIHNCDTIDGIVSKYVQRAQETLRSKSPEEVKNSKLSLIESLLITDGILPEDILTVLLDMMLIGVNTTAHCVAFLFYHLSKNPRAQHKLYEEIKNVPDKLQKEDLKKLSYLQACIKESLRLKPPMPVLSRILTKDIVVYNYVIPKGTYMLLATHLSSTKEEFFEDAEKYRPDRWLSPEMNESHVEHLASIPFGHGARACLAKELAEIQISALLVKILKRFRIEYHYGEIGSNNKLLAAPNRPLKFRFLDRST